MEAVWVRLLQLGVPLWRSRWLLNVGASLLAATRCPILGLPALVDGGLGRKLASLHLARVSRAHRVGHRAARRRPLRLLGHVRVLLHLLLLLLLLLVGCGGVAVLVRTRHVVAVLQARIHSLNQ